MTRRRWVALVVLLAAVVAGAMRVVLWQPPATAPRAADAHPSAVGVVHVHTTHSDGGGSIADVAAAAAAADLDFVVITDHNTLDGRAFAGYVDGVLVIVGIEISTVSGHLLALGISEPTFRFAGDAADVVADVADLGGLALVAHPMSPSEELRWTDWPLPGRWGIEVFNGDTQWRQAGWGRALWTTLLYPLNPTYALAGLLLARPPALDLWDELLADRPVPAIAGSDSHSFIGLGDAFAVGLPGYRPVFTLLRNHVRLRSPLEGDAHSDTAAIIEALASGRTHIGADGVAPTHGFAFVANDGDKTWQMGETVPPTAALRLSVPGDLPPDAAVTLLRNGSPVTTTSAPLTWSPVDAGVYRVEVQLPGWRAPWIASNPIYVFPPAARAARARRLRRPEPVVPGPVRRRVDALGAETTFFSASDASTVVRDGILDPGAGPNGGDAARLEFALGTPSPDHPSPFAALSSFEPRDLSDGSGLVFSLRGDGVYRVYVQVRDRNPAATTGDGTEWWSTSIKTSTEWTRVALPFTRFRSRDQETDGQLDLDQIEGLVFLVDTGTVPPGTSGIVWIGDLDVY